MRSLCLAFYLAWALFRSSFAWRFPPRRPRQHWMLQEHRSWYSTLAQGGSLSKLNAMHPEISPGESGDNVESDVAPTEYLPVVAEGGEHLGQVADASTAGETVATLESQRQPWWEDERRTEGIPTLTPTTQWRMTLSLKDPALKGEAGEVTDIAVRVRFNEEPGYEPPQGSLDVIEDCPYFLQQPGKTRWILSEGEDRRSAGFWIWGLFEEPLYPFLLLQMQNLEIDLKGGGRITPGTLYVKVDHRRDEKLGPTLNSGTVGVRYVERVKVDPLGMAEAEIANVIPCGSVRFRPV